MAYDPVRARLKAKRVEIMDIAQWTELSVDSCDLCGSAEKKALEAAAFVVECPRCGFIYVDRRPTTDTVSRHYGEQHYEQWIEEEVGRQKMWRKRWLKVGRLRTPGKWLDVGCGLGTFLQFAREDGWDVSGTELSHAAAESVRRRYGFEVSEGTLESCGFPDASFDAVSLWHVLEHLPSPGAGLREIRRVLKPDGLLVVAVPNASNWKVPIKRLLGRCVYPPLWECREIHLSHFTPRTLSRILRDSGFDVIRLLPDDYYANPSLLTAVRYRAGCILKNWAGLLITTTMCAVARARGEHERES